MKGVKINGFIVVTGPDMSGCGRGSVVYDIFTTYAKFVRWMNERYNHGRDNAFTITYEGGRQRTYMRNNNLGRLSYFELPKKGLDGMKVRYPYSYGTVQVVYEVDRSDR